jgi:hypothetical protein
MTDGENSETAELRQQLAELLALNQILKDQHAVTTQRVDTLNQFVLRAAGASSVENVLVKGFETLSAQLEPLRDLTQKRTLLSEAALNRLGDLRKSLNRPDWSDGRAFTDDDLDELSPDDSIQIMGDAL